MNKQSRNSLIKRVAEIEGLTNEEKSQLMELLRKDKAYGLVWEDKPETIEERLQNELPVLTEVKERAIISDNPEAPNHILIEGDNLEALTTLAYTHAGKIDVIYIDPPYNTGNNDFVYNDRFVDSNDSYRHSKWLSFMNKRLRIAKQLLSDKGVIFISIDDNEQSQLKLLCDEVFSNQFIGNVVWFKKRKGSFLSNKLVSMTEYVLVYSNNSNIKLFGGLPSNSESQPIVKRTNSVKRLNFNANIVKTKLSDGVYRAGHYGNGTSASLLVNDIEVRDGYIITPFAIEAPFVWGQDFLDSEINNGTEILINTINFQVRVIRHNNDSIKAFPSFIDGREFNATNEDAYEKLKEIFNEDNPFSYSKPVNLVQKLILANSYYDKDITILDFFAGSGTTLHATMQLNDDVDYGGRRRCILVTNNENNICEEVTYERNKRVINGYTTPTGEEVSGLRNNTLRYYRTAFVPAEKTNANKRTLVAAATDMLCIKNDIFTEQELFAGRKLKKNAARYFDDGKKQMLIIYNELAVEAFAEQIREHFSSENKLLVYVFSVNSYAYTDSFEEVLDKVELCALPDAIYKAYKSVIKPKRKFSEQAESIVEGFSELENEEMSNNEAE